MTGTAIAARIRLVLCNLADWLDSRSKTSAPIGALVLFTAINAHAQTTDLTGISAAYTVETRDKAGLSGLEHLNLQIYRGNGWLYKQTSGQTFAEMWQLTTSGKLIYQRVYPDYKFIIDYGANSPRVPGAHSLVVSAGIIKADWLAMNTCPEQKHDGYVISCRGEDDQQLLWFEELSLPYQASWQHANSKRSLTLKQLQHFDSRAFLTELGAYESMDYADIGDNEAHPTLRTILSPSALGVGYPGHGKTPAGDHHNH